MHDLVDDSGSVIPSQVDLSRPCVWDDRAGRAKCNVLEQLGRGWHSVEDFYSHSNWDDHAGPGKIGVDNAPGLGGRIIADFFSLRRYSRMPEGDWVKEATDAIPRELASGCYPDYESAGVLADCRGRITHDGVLNKDDPSSPRSKIDDNFQQATRLAANDIQRQWQDFVNELIDWYARRSVGMICALTHDNPGKDCR